MYVIREVVSCRPGKVRQMVDKFKTIGTMMRDMGHEPFRVMTDVIGEPFWTLIAERSVSSIDEFLEMERSLMANDAFRAAMAGYHDLVAGGRREIYRIET